MEKPKPNSLDRSPNRTPMEQLSIEEMLEKAGNNHKYQLKIQTIFFLVFLFASFIQMGFPIIFQPAKFVCDQGQDCSDSAVCSRQTYTLSDSIISVAYSFNLVCDRKQILRTCFNAFLYGGFLGSLYYGEIIERRGRKYALIESMIMMVGGLTLSLLSGSAVLFSFGVFFFNAGFRGFYNASLLSVCEVVNQLMRAGTPMFLSIGWALGQIIIAFLGIWLINWRIIFLFTAIPLSILLYYTYTIAKQSPRFCVTKHEYSQAISIVQEIAAENNRPFENYQLKEQRQYQQRMEGYREIMAGGEVSSRQKHHSYASLLKFKSIRMRVLVVGAIWSLFSLSYFISASTSINPSRSPVFNIALAGIIEIVAYIFSMVTSLSYGRVYIIKKLLICSAGIHLVYYFIQPKDHYEGVEKGVVIFLDILIRVLMSIGNTFLAIYSIELFPTSIRHYALGSLGFITKLMYMFSYTFDVFWKARFINSNFIIGILFAATYFLTVKLRETREVAFKDNLSEDGDNLLMNQTTAEIF